MRVNNIDGVKLNAQNAVKYMNAPYDSYIASRRTNVYLHMYNCIDNPTLGLLARHEAKKGVRLNKNIISNNNQLLSLQNEYKNLVTQFSHVQFKLYPKTSKLRQTLIDSNRLSLDKVAPKASKLTKMFIKLKCLAR